MAVAFAVRLCCCFATVFSRDLLRKIVRDACRASCRHRSKVLSNIQQIDSILSSVLHIVLAARALFLNSTDSEIKGSIELIGGQSAANHSPPSDCAIRSYSSVYHRRFILKTICDLEFSPGLKIFLLSDFTMDCVPRQGRDRGLCATAENCVPRQWIGCHGRGLCATAKDCVP